MKSNNYSLGIDAKSRKEVKGKKVPCSSDKKVKLDSQSSDVGMEAGPKSPGMINISMNTFSLSLVDLHAF